jgi:hypothetical protein
VNVCVLVLVLVDVCVCVRLLESETERERESVYVYEYVYVFYSNAILFLHQINVGSAVRTVQYVTGELEHPVKGERE